MGVEEFCDFLVEELENKIKEVGPDKVAAFIAEPILGAGGVSVPPECYHRRTWEVCKSYDVLYISDEVVTAFGRLGHWFASKDVFDIAGRATGGGNPDWLKSHEPAVETAPAVQSCLSAGAHLTGITIADEICFSPFGENAHYGTPLNPVAPDRVPGGSSSGSGSATASGLVDFALGTDTGGSVRIPASFCGIYGLRPTHDRIPLEGVMPLASSYDTIGWFARDPAVMECAARVLFDDWVAPEMPTRMLMPADAWAIADEAVWAALAPAVAQLVGLVDEPEEAPLGGDTLDSMADTYATLQGREAWQTHRDWVERENPAFGPGVAERFRAIAKITDDAVAAAQGLREAHTVRMLDLLPEGRVMVLPTAPCIAPRCGSPPAELADIRRRILTLTSIAGHAGLPQISLPVATADDCPAGLSIIAPRGGDEVLLDMASRLLKNSSPLAV